MARSLHFGQSPTRLRLLLGVLFLALALPSALLFWQTQRQIRLEAWHQHRVLAEQISQRIESDLQRLVSVEEARGFAEYRFLTVAGDPGGTVLSQRSPIAVLPREAELPGLLGHFEVDAAGSFSTPLLPEPAEDPARYGLSEAEWRERLALRDALLDVLSRNRLLAAARVRRVADGADSGDRLITAEEDALPVPAQAAFDLLKVAMPAPQASSRDAPAADARARRREDAVVVERARPASAREEAPAAPRISIFESALDPFEFSRLDSGHFVLFRRVWRDGSRTIQGLLLEPDGFLSGTIVRPFGDSPLAAVGELRIAYRGELLRRDAGQAEAEEASASAEPLHQHRLSAPLGDLQLELSLHRLPSGPGARIATWTGIVLLGVLLTAFVVLYRLGLGQLRLARQQQDFISAVSHELKTPLTSIRMYGELLREGWVPEDKRREYYAYIHDESERLSRLISNVLQLARMERQELVLEIKAVAMSDLFDLLRSRLSGQIERAGFSASFTLDPAVAGCTVEVDGDALLQVLINLLDNALKFSVGAELKRVEIAARPEGDGAVVLSVRDYGPGVPHAQMRRIFELFYRAGNELTRETVGTGIGLALVRQLATAMGGSVDVVNREPGAEFRLRLPSRRCDIGGRRGKGPITSQAGSSAAR